MVKRGFQFFVFSISVLAVVLSLGIVSANAAVTSILLNSNSTSVGDNDGHFTINWTADGSDAGNYTIYMWMGGVGLISLAAVNSSNYSATGYNFTNVTEANYTFTIESWTAANATKTNSTNVSVYVDLTVPVMTFTIPVTGWAMGNVLPAVNVTDSLSNITDPGTFYYGFENSTGNFSISSDNCVWTDVTASGFNCTSTFNVSTLADGNYTFWANVSDAAGNLGYVRVGASTAFGVDSAGPVVSISQTLSSSSPTGITFSKSCTDSGSGVVTCSVSSSSGTFSGNDLTGLTCGASYDITLTSTDGLGNSRSTTTAMTTSTCPSRGSGVTTSSPWTSTHTLDDDTFTQGYTGQIGANKRIQVQIGTEAHHVGVVSVSASEVTIEIASDPVTVKLSPGEDTKVDVNNDQFYDIHVLLNSIVNGKADLTIKKISEEVPAGSGNVATTGEVENGVSGESEDVLGENRDLTWLWVLIAVAIVLVVLKLGVKKKKRISRF